MDRQELGERAIAYNKGWEMGYEHGHRQGFNDGRIMQKRHEDHVNWSRLVWVVIACAFIGCLFAILAYTAVFMML